jgi:hypothetical protein
MAHLDRQNYSNQHGALIEDLDNNNRKEVNGNKTVNYNKAVASEESVNYSKAVMKGNCKPQQSSN